ncbi:MAG: hypothetical protein ACHQQS_01600 [Thermoanaerobaculales bacterium]
MQRMVRPELTSPRTIPALPGTAPTSFSAWVEIAAEARVSVAEWGVHEDAWLHWTVPVVDGHPLVDRAVRFDPLLRAGFPGEPPAALQGEPASLDEAEAAQLCVALAAGYAPSLLFHPGLGLTSRLDEEAGEFRQRCLAVVAPALQRGLVGAELVPRALAVLRDAVRSHALVGDEFAIKRWLVRLAWYPNGVGPAREGGECSRGSATGWGR